MRNKNKTQQYVFMHIINSPNRVILYLTQASTKIMNPSRIVVLRFKQHQGAACCLLLLSRLPVSFQHKSTFDLCLTAKIRKEATPLYHEKPSLEYLKTAFDSYWLSLEPLG